MTGLARRTVALPDEAATARLGEDLALAIAPGMALLLSGDLGAGKTSLARSLLRALHDDAGLEVPSPTFTLLQPYEGARVPVAHVDLYRIADPAEVEELDLPGWLDRGALLVEWPERGGLAPGAGRVGNALGFGGTETGRVATVEAEDTVLARLDRIRAGRAFLEGAGWGAAGRRFLQGDASSRRFERVALGGGTAILMDSPRRPDGPPVMDGLPYSRIAMLAEDVRPFVAVGAHLTRVGLSAPDLLAHDLDAGFLLAEDLGDEKIAVAGAPVPERYLVAADVLAHLHRTAAPDELPLPDGGRHRLAAFDQRVFRAELSLYPDWYLAARGTVLDPDRRAAFEAVWRDLLAIALAGERHLALRDFHSPNLLWLPEREGVRRIGLIDHQDALIGPTAYDVASLAQDARVTVPEALERAILARYVAGRTGEAGFDETAFRTAYAILAAQRAVRIMGTFTRLDRRDGKPAYLAHIPRLEAYLARTLAHQALAPLRDWFAAGTPANFP